MKPKGKILSLLLVICLVAGLLPTTAFALDGDKTIMLGTSGISGYDSTNGYDYIYFGDWNTSDSSAPFGPIKWRVLDNQTNTGETGLFLLSDGLLGTGQWGGVYFDNSGSDSNVWQKSTAQTWCKNFYSNNFSSKEQNAVLETTKSDTEFTSSTNVPFAASENILNGDKVFFLSAQEAESSKYGFTNNTARIANYGNSAGYWWLRSPYADYTDTAGFVTYFGYVYYYIVYDDWAARPAFNLNLNSVLFTSAAVGGKTDSAVDSSLTTVADYAGNEWKLTLLDDEHKDFEISNATINGDGDTIAFSYSGAQTGTNEYISVVIEDNGAITHYGRILQLDGTTGGASGTASLTLPAGVTLGNDTKLYVFNEQYNGGENDDTKLTDYGSAPIEVNPTVDDTAPTLSGGSATRDSETSATVKFTSSEAGTCYYIAQDTEITLTKEQIAAQGIEQVCSAGENEIELGSITASAWYVAVVAQDAAGNISDVLTIQIPAYTYTLTVELNGGSGNTTGGVYPAGEVVNIDAGSRSNYRFNGWTSSNGGTFDDASSANTTFTMPAGNVTITANWQYDPPYIPPTKPDGPSTGTSDGWEGIVDELADAEDGDTITIDMNGETEVPGEIFEEVAGKDVTVEFELEDGISWTVNGQDIPTATDFSDLDLGVDLGTKGISVDVINTVTGELGSVQITLAHDGEFGFTMTLTAPVGVKNAGLWANLYHYDEDAGKMVYQTAALVDEDGNVALPFDHASQYALVLDSKSHELPFTDLTAGAWYLDAVAYVYRHDIMEGMSATTFQPNGTLSRAMAVQIFYNLEGQPDVSDENLGYPYEDVDAQAWYGNAVYWARITGVATGYGDGTFQPTDSITRQEFAQMLYNYAKYKGYDLTAEGDLTAFPDGDQVQEWALPAMAWANGNALINGHDNGTIDAGGNGTRAQAASILMRFDLNLVKAD